MTPDLPLPWTRRGAALVVLAAVLLAVGCVAATAAQGPADWRVVAAFGAFILLGEVVRMTLPGDREAAPLGAAGALAYALLATLGGSDAVTRHRWWEVVAVTAVAVLLGALPHAAAGRAPRLDDMARRVLSTAFAAALFRSLLDSRLYDDIARPPWRLALVMVLVVTLTAVVDAAVAAAVRAQDDGARFLPAYRDELRALGGIGSAIGATGMLIALAAATMSFWALPVFAVPLLLTQFAFRRFAAVRTTYGQTVRALSRITEVAGYTEAGHARRVSELAVAVGRDLGMGEAELRDLEYAALMHDIGQLSLADPIPGGATVVAAPAEQQRIATLGAEVIRQTGVLDTVATIVERQAEPYRRANQPEAGGVPFGSRIIKVVNAYDDLVGDSPSPDRRLAALERLHLGMAYEYDPVAVGALARVVLQR